MRQIIRLTESDLHKIIKESVNILLKEHEYGQMSPLGRRLTDAEIRELFPDDTKMFNDLEKWERSQYNVADEDRYAVDSDGDPMI